MRWVRAPDAVAMAVLGGLASTANAPINPAATLPVPTPIRSRLKSLTARRPAHRRLTMTGHSRATWAVPTKRSWFILADPAQPALTLLRPLRRWGDDSAGTKPRTAERRKNLCLTSR